MNVHSQTVVVIGGLLEPCGNIGTEGRFALLPVPWDRKKFAEVASQHIHFEFGQKARIIDWKNVGFPEDPEDDRALARGVGLRMWAVTGKDAKLLLSLMAHDWSTGEWPPKMWRRCARLIDHLSEHVPPSTKFSWPRENPDDEACLAEAESLIQAPFKS